MINFAHLCCYHCSGQRGRQYHQVNTSSSVCYPLVVVTILAEICSIAQKIAQSHIQAHTARQQYYQIGLLFINVRWI